MIAWSDGLKTSYSLDHDEIHNVKDEQVEEEAATDEGDYECEGGWVHNAAVNQRMNCDAGMLHWQSKKYALYQYDQAQLPVSWKPSQAYGYCGSSQAPSSPGVASQIGFAIIRSLKRASPRARS